MSVSEKKVNHYNRPGLPALTYRLGTHSAFLRRMLTRLPTQEVDESLPLARLTTRDLTDPAIALLDAWASVADVLCFYQERIANESYLRTATERRSVLELARAIGYELNPGVAASTYLAFTVEEPAGVTGAQSVPGAATVPTEVTVPEGTQVKSVPGPGKKPQTFETIEEIEARVEWNALTPREPWTLKTPEITHGTQSLYLEGTATQLQPGDAILLAGDSRDRFPGSERWDFRILETVTTDTDEDYTYVTWKLGLGHEKPTVAPADNPRVFAFRARAALFGYNAPDWRVLPDDTKVKYIPERLLGLDFVANEVTAKQGKTLTVGEPFPYGEERDKVVVITDNNTLFCVKGETPASLNDVTVGDKVAGRVTKKEGQYVAEVIAVIPPKPGTTTVSEDANKKEWEAWVKCFANAYDEWPGFEIHSTDQEIDLDNVYPKVLEDSWIALAKPTYVELYKVKEASKASRTDFTLTSKCTRLQLDAWEHLAWFGGRDRRDTVVYIESEELTLAKIKKPLRKDVSGKSVELDQVVLGLEQGRTLVFSGQLLRVEVAEGGIFLSVDGGDNWTQPTTSPTHNDVRALAISTGGNVIYAGTVGSGVFASSDEGLTWEARNSGLGSLDVYSLLVHTRNTLFAGTADGVSRSRNGGKTWTAVNKGLADTNVRALISLEKSDVQRFKKLADSLPSRRPALGASLESAVAADIVEARLSVEVSSTISTLASLLPGGAIDYIFAGTTSGVYRSTNEGESWQAFSAGLVQKDVRALTVGVDGTIFAGTAGGGVYRSASLGESWMPANGALLQNLYVYALAVDPKGALFAGTSGSGVFYSTDSGDNWTQLNDGLTNKDVRALTVDPEGHLLAGTAGGGVLRLEQQTNGEQEWTSLDDGLLNADVRTLAAATSTSLFAGTRGVDSLVSADGLQSVTLTAGDQLLVTAAPQDASRGEKKWLLEDRDGFTGYVESGPCGLELEEADEDDEVVSEAAFIDKVSHTQKRTTIFLKSALQNYYDRTTLTIYGNVARATHGETIEEVLGSGDGSKANQRFKLKKPPLTYTSAATATGGQTTLEVRVNDVLWEEVSSLYDLDAQEQAYSVRLDDDGYAHVIFGDGKSGTRLPSGQENVKATYRSGIGSDGTVDAGSLILLQKRPLGIRQVTNPLTASGAAEPETLAKARTKAPLTVLTLDRIVSLRDYEDFTRTFAGIGKAQAVALWSGESQLVHITVAATDGSEVDSTSALYTNLVSAIDKVRGPVSQVRVDSYQLLYFNVKAKIRVDPRYKAEEVLLEVEEALEEAFAFDQRSFGQAVTAAEVITVIQQIEGVIATDLDDLYLHASGASAGQADPATRLLAARARWCDGTIQPAQLLLINPVGITLTEMGA
jgi:hypothetical protein